MMNALTTTAMPLQDMQTLAVAIAKSALFGIRTPEQALVLMAIAQAEGRHPVEAARDYDIINNRPAKKAEAMLRDFIQAGGKVQWHSLTDELADATFTHPQTGEVRIDWDMKRAQTAFGKKEMYAKFPRQMLRSRVVSEGVRTLWPLATSGMYVPEEQADIPPEHNGPMLEAKPEREAVNAEVPLKAAATKAMAEHPIKRPWRSAEGEDADRWEAAERERAAAAATARGDRKVDPAVYETPQLDLLKERDSRKWLQNLELALANAQTREEVETIATHSSVENTTATAPEAIKLRVSELLAKAWGRFVKTNQEPPADLSDETLGEVEITGADKVQAG